MFVQKMFGRWLLIGLVAVCMATAQTRAYAWKFVIVGDSRGDNNGINQPILSEIAAEIVSQDAEFVLFPGDMVNGSSIDSVFQSMLTSWRTTMQPVYDADIAVYPVRGNHEDHSVTVWNNVFSGDYAMPSNGPTGETNLTYSATHNNVFIAGMDQYVTDARVNQPWLTSQLAANEQPHVFVFGHEPAYRVDHSDCLDDHPSNRDAFVSNLLAAGARTYSAGHDHFYDHARIDDGDADPSNDLHQLIVGTAGAPLRDWSPPYVGDTGGTTPTQVYHEKQYGYTLAEVDGDDITLTWMHRTGTDTYVATAEVLSYTAAAGQVTQMATFQQGVDGYTSAVDTYLQQASPDANNSAAVELNVDTDDPPSSSNHAQGLVRYDDIFGWGEGQIPTIDVTINWAAVQLQTTNAGDGAALHRMVASWSDTDTWNSLSGGIQTDGAEAAVTAEVTTRDVGTGGTVVDVTSSLQTWLADGDPNGANLGWAFMPSGTDGWDFDSAEGSTTPMLMIDYTAPDPATVIDLLYDAINAANTDARYDFDGDGGAADLQDMDYLIHTVLDTQYGDVDLQGDVDVDDFAVITGAGWQQTSGMGWADGDMDGDGDVDVDDAAIVTSHWQWIRGGGGLSGEIAGVLLTIGLLGLAFYGWRRKR